MRHYYVNGERKISITVVLDEDDYAVLARLARTPSLGIRELLRKHE